MQTNRISSLLFIVILLFALSLCAAEDNAESSLAPGVAEAAMGLAAELPPPLPVAAPESGMTANAPAIQTSAPANPATPPEPHKPTRTALIAYTMAGNLVRQREYKEALRYYMTAIQSDPAYTEAMSDAALIYKHLGEYEEGEALLQRAIRLESAHADLYHNLGEIYQAWGLSLLQQQNLDSGMKQVNEAVKAYGKAIELSEAQGVLATRAASYFRLGEICYFANHDIPGARQYWWKVTQLHAPTPVLGEKQGVYWRHTAMRINLQTWQGWAEQYLEQIERMRFGSEPQPQPTPAARPGESAPPSFAEERAPAASASSSRPTPAPESRTDDDYRFWRWKRH